MHTKVWALVGTFSVLLFASSAAFACGCKDHKEASCSGAAKAELEKRVEHKSSERAQLRLELESKDKTPAIASMVRHGRSAMARERINQHTP